MKNKILKAVSAFPFWVPYPFIFFAVDYYLKDELSWLSIVLAAFLGVISFIYAAAGKEKEMIFGCDVGILISAIITCAAEDSFDKSLSYPFGSYLSFVLFLILAVKFIPLFATVAVKIIKKIKNKA